MEESKENDFEIEIISEDGEIVGSDICVAQEKEF
jgi:hypothetical protein